jgi:hypothetical protein
VETRGLIRRLNFGDLVLRRPEMLDAYPMFGVARAFPRGRVPVSAVFSGVFSTGSPFQPEKRSDNISHRILEYSRFSP